MRPNSSLAGLITIIDQRSFFFSFRRGFPPPMFPPPMVGPHMGPYASGAIPPGLTGMCDTRTNGSRAIVEAYDPFHTHASLYRVWRAVRSGTCRIRQLHIHSSGIANRLSYRTCSLDQAILLQVQWVQMAMVYHVDPSSLPGHPEEILLHKAEALVHYRILAIV
jgi:hypothetical protein